jgi:hypothetical protein
MQGFHKELIHPTLFSHPSGVHDPDRGPDAPDYVQIMGYEKHGELIFSDQELKQAQDLGLNGHVKRRSWLIRDDEGGIACDGNRNQHPLSLPAGELVRILKIPFIRGVKTDLLQESYRDVPCFFPG